MMVRRLGALVLALVVTATPAVVAACEIVCASREGHSSHGEAMTPRHSCHGTHPAGIIGSVTGADHVCGHGDELPVALCKPDARTAPALDIAVAAPASHPQPSGTCSRSCEATSSPPGRPYLLAPLRI